MESDRISTYLREKIKRDFLLGKFNGQPKIPTSVELDRAVQEKLKSADNGIIGKVRTMGYRSLSDPGKYNENFRDVKDNVEYLLGEVTNEVNTVLDLINDSTAEKNNSLRELKNIESSFNEIENGRMTSNGLSYVISDSFNDLTKVDTDRTTADINLNAGTVGLSLAKSNQLQFPHYRSQKRGILTFTEGGQSIISQEQVPGTSFGAMFTTDETDRWEYEIMTREPTTLTCYFTVKLSEIGEVVDINEVNIKLSTNSTIDKSNPNGIIYLEYLNMDKTDRTWKRIPGGLSPISSTEINFKFLIPPTTHIRVYITKDWPDDSSNNSYHLGFTELLVRKSETTYESILTSKPLEIEAYRTETSSIYSASVEVDAKKQPGCNIKYYVGIDETIAGKVTNADGEVVDIHADDAMFFTANGKNLKNETENYYVYASELREHQAISGASYYLNWEPKWLEIAPINDPTAKIPPIRFFNTTIANKQVHDMYYLSPRPAYTGPWPVASYAGTWADDWDGTAGGFPQEGFIWGENPLTFAGAWWGDGLGIPGWYRPNHPSCSGTQTWTSPGKISYPDFIESRYDADGNPALDEDGKPIQLHYWKIFKWPKDYLPIPGSVKLFVQNDADETDSTVNNKQYWKWNYKWKEGLKETTVNFKIRAGTHYYNIRLEDVTDVKGLQIVKNTFTDLKFTNFNPQEVSDFFIDYGVEYTYDEETKQHQRIEVDPEFKDMRAVIVIPEALLTYKTITGNESPEMSVTFKYIAKDETEAVWESFMYVPPNTTEGLTFGHIDNYSNSIRKVIIDSLNDHGIIIDSITISAESADNVSFNTIPIPLGWSKIRIYTDIDMTRFGVDSSIALWNPDHISIQTVEGFYIDKVNLGTDGTVTNSILANIDFASSGLIAGLPIKCYTQDTNEDEVPRDAIITNVDTTKLQVAFDDPDEKFYIKRYQIQDFNLVHGFSHSREVKLGSAIKSMNEVDIYTLMHDVDLKDDMKFAIIEDVDECKYLVVRTPNQDSFPKNLVNMLHYTRTYLDDNTNTYVTFTTGSRGNYHNHPMPTSDSLVWPDFSDRPANTKPNVTYRNISSYGTTMQIDDPAASGFLFWNTAENLQTYYRIEYAIPVSNRPASRIFFMAKLISDSPGVSPSLNSYNLILNGEGDVRMNI